MHPSPRLYLTGDSCAGVSTLGAALKGTCQVPQIDVDDYYWLPTDLPFTCKRPPEDRLRLIAQEKARGIFAGWRSKPPPSATWTATARWRICAIPFWHGWRGNRGCGNGERGITQVWPTSCFQPD